MKLILLSIAITAVSVLLLGIRVLFVKGGRFPSPHIKDSAALRRQGIKCAHDDKN